MTGIRGRSTRRIRQIKRQMRADRAQPCRRCGQEIDYDAEPGEANAFNAGHIKAWSKFPELREDPANFQPEHEHCNKHAGNRDERPGLGMVGQEW